MSKGFLKPLDLLVRGCAGITSTESGGQRRDMAKPMWDAQTIGRLISPELGIEQVG